MTVTLGIVILLIAGVVAAGSWRTAARGRSQHETAVLDRDRERSERQYRDSGPDRHTRQL